MSVCLSVFPQKCQKGKCRLLSLIDRIDNLNIDNEKVNNEVFWDKKLPMKRSRVEL